jgi:hypothetical protein
MEVLKKLDLKCLIMKFKVRFTQAANILKKVVTFNWSVISYNAKSLFLN